MAGITSYGAYIPFHRLDREEISRAWGVATPRGERAVANFDEDSVTMAVAASLDCLKGIDAKSVDGIIFGTTTSPYVEKLSSAIIAAALDLRSNIFALDITNTLRVGTTAILTALTMVKAEEIGSILVAVADCRLGPPASEFEYGFGDGAAAFLITDNDVIAINRGYYSVCDEFSGIWRSYGDVYVRSWEDRMILDVGYSSKLPEAITGLIKKYNLELDDFARIVYDGPTDARRHRRVAQDLKISPEKVQDPMFSTVGCTGSAMAPIMMAAALDEARANDNLLLASYGNGADALWFEVTSNSAKSTNHRKVKGHIDSKREITNYETYLKWRGIVTAQIVRRPERDPVSLSALWRARKEVLGLYGVKCNNCGTPQYSAPSTVAVGGSVPTRVCVACQAKDDFEDYRFADKKATIKSFTHDLLAASLDPPSTNAVIDFEGGGRGAFDVTDRDPEKIEVGMPVEMTFRKLFYDRGIHNYYWKVTPTRF